MIHGDVVMYGCHKLFFYRGHVNVCHMSCDSSVSMYEAAVSCITDQVYKKGDKHDVRTVTYGYSS